MNIFKSEVTVLIYYCFSLHFKMVKYFLKICIVFIQMFNFAIYYISCILLQIWMNQGVCPTAGGTLIAHGNHEKIHPTKQIHSFDLWWDSLYHIFTLHTFTTNGTKIQDTKSEVTERAKYG